MTSAGLYYRIGAFTGVCAATGETLPPGAEAVVALVEREDEEGFERLDYSAAAWEAGHRPPRLLGFWRTTVPEPNQKRKVFVDDDLLVNLFERLAEDERPARVAMRFVILLVLMRKKLARHVGRVGEGADERWLVRLKGSSPDEPPIEVINPHLSQADVERMSLDLGEILSGEES